MNRFEKGTKVKLTKAWAEWTLENQEGWELPHTAEIRAKDVKEYETRMQLAMLVILEEPPICTVQSINGDTYYIDLGKYGSTFIDYEDVYLASNMEIELDFSAKSIKVITEISKKTGVSIGAVASVLIQHAYITGRLLRA